MYNILQQRRAVGLLRCGGPLGAMEGHTTPTAAGAPAGEVTVSFRAEAADFLPAHGDGAPARILNLSKRGGSSRATLQLGGRVFDLQVPQTLAELGPEVRIAPRRLLIHAP